MPVGNFAQSVLGQTPPGVLFKALTLAPRCVAIMTLSNLPRSALCINNIIIASSPF